MELVLPRLGLTMEEGIILKWYKSPGDLFASGEPLFETETDKVTMDVEAEEAGQLVKILVPEGQKVAVGVVVAHYLRAGEEANQKVTLTELPYELEEEKRSSQAKPGSEAPSTGQRIPSDRVHASPRARRLARELQIDLSILKEGSGQGGRIVSTDVIAEKEKRKPLSSLSLPPAVHVEGAQMGTESVPAIRRVIAERMASSFASVPHFYLTIEVDVDELLRLKQRLSHVLMKGGGPRLSLTDFFLRATAVAIADHPEVNVSWEGGRIRRHSSVNIGLAVEVKGGVLLPVLQNVNLLDLPDICRLRAELVRRARSGVLKRSDSGVASASLSNLGMYGIDQFQGILNPPESLLLAIGRVRERVISLAGVPTVRFTVFCTVSADHRVLDGGMVARWLSRIGDLLTRPNELCPHQ